MNQPANADRQIDRAEELSVKIEGSGKLKVILERKPGIGTGDEAALSLRTV